MAFVAGSKLIAVNWGQVHAPWCLAACNGFAHAQCSSDEDCESGQTCVRRMGPRPAGEKLDVVNVDESDIVSSACMDAPSATP